MPFNLEGITTGLLGYTLKKEFFSEAIFYRETETFNFEIYSSDISGLSPANIQNNIYNEFTKNYSGNVFVKLFNIPNQYTMPSDSIRVGKFNVEVEVVYAPTGLSNISDLSSAYYLGVNNNFFNTYDTPLMDFKDEYNFAQDENGKQSLEHNVSFTLLSGGKSLATSLISGIFANDQNTTFGISVLSGFITGANEANVLNYHTETYDLLKNNFSFSRKREFLPQDASSFNYNLSHIISLKENGIFDISEKCDLFGKITFSQAKQGLDVVYNGSYSRCSDFYDTYRVLLAPTTVNGELVNLPIKLVKTYNTQSLSASYEVVYSDNPELSSNGSSTEEVIEIDISPKNVVSISDKYNFTFDRRDSAFIGANSLITNAYNGSSTNIQNYYQNGSFYNPNWPLNLIKTNATWPVIKNKASIELMFTNEPKYFITLNGVFFYSLDYKVNNTQPVDIINEYKIVNRSNKLSVLNYAYQTEKGEITITLEGGIGRNPNEFINGFRNDLAIYLEALYTKGITLFMEQFSKVLPVAFTYYLSDIKYSLNSDGMLQVELIFTYTLKKYII